MIEVVRLQYSASEFREQVRFFVGSAGRTDHPDRPAAVVVADFRKLLPDQLERFFPCRRSQPAFLADQRLRQSLFVIGKVEPIASLDTKEVSVGATLVAVVPADNFRARVRSPHAQRGLAAVAAMRAHCAYMLHFPWPRFIAICARGEGAHRADVDAHAALFALQVIFFIGSDERTYATVLHPESPNVHALAAHAHAAVAENAARPVEEHHGRPLLLVLVVLRLHEFRFRRAVGERHVLQFALAAGVANRAIQRMVAQQHLEHRLASLLNFVHVGDHDHALADHGGARGLELGHLLHFHHAHAASALQRKIWVIAKRRHFDAHGLAGFNEQRAPGGRDLLAVDSKIYISHICSAGVPPAVAGRLALASLSNLNPAGTRPQFGPAGRRPYTRTGSSAPAFSYGHGRPSKWASNSWRNFFTNAIVGIAAASPSGQNVRPSMFSARYCMLSMSFIMPPPLWNRISVFFSQSVPSRQGMHQPQLSCW